MKSRISGLFLFLLAMNISSTSLAWCFYYDYSTCFHLHGQYLTWHTDVAAASIKLITRIATLLLYIFPNNANTLRPDRKTRGHCNQIWPIIFVSSVNFFCVKVCPVNILAIDGQAERMKGCADDDFTVHASESAALNLLPEVGVERRTRNCWNLERIMVGPRHSFYTRPPTIFSSGVYGSWKCFFWWWEVLSLTKQWPTHIIDFLQEILQRNQAVTKIKRVTWKDICHAWNVVWNTL